MRPLSPPNTDPDRDSGPAYDEDDDAARKRCKVQLEVADLPRAQSPDVDHPSLSSVSPRQEEAGAAPAEPATQSDAQASLSASEAWRRLLARPPNAPRKPPPKASSAPQRSPSTTRSKTQLFLDVTNSKVSAPVQCPTCQMTYFRGQPDDERAHEAHHRAHKLGIRLATSLVKAHTLLQLASDLLVIRVAQSSPQALKSKTLAVIDLVDNELGAAFADRQVLLERCQVFLAVSSEQHAVVGCLVAEPVPSGHVLPHRGAVAPHGPATWCGINRIWVKASHRRRGIATGLLDCARDYLTFGYRFERDQVVFSQPTTTGRLLAEHYLGSQAVPVYDAART